MTSAGTVDELVERLGLWLGTLLGLAAVVTALAFFTVRAALRPSTEGRAGRPVS